MNLTIIGVGYVGLVAGTCFAEMGNKVTCVDIDHKKISALQRGIVPIYEPGLEPMVKRNINNGTLKFNTTLKDCLNFTDIVFIAVGTPMGEDGSADLQYVLNVAKTIGEHMTKPLIVVGKSTVPVGTADKVKNIILRNLEKRKMKIEFQVVSNPEFLKEGDAISDFLKPDRVVVGTDNKETAEIIRELYAPFFRSSMDRMLIMDVKSAEMTKYVANAMLATKISFMNEVANICELVGADVNKVRIGIGSDSRIGYSFIYPGSGYGGSCFPKDVRALKKTAEEVGYKAQLLYAVEDINERQKLVISKKVINHFESNIKGKVFAVWGLAFKPGTDDMRESPAIYIIKELIAKGATVQAYDPKAMHEAKNFYLKDQKNLEYATSQYQALNNADALLLLTEWKEFRSPDFVEIKNRLKQPLIFDGRNQYNDQRIKEMGFQYHQIGKRVE